MTITSLDGAMAGMIPPESFLKVGAATVAGRLYSPFYVAGRPGAAVAPSPGIGGAALTSYSGSLPWYNPASGNGYLSRFAADCNVAGTLILCDRLWHNSGINVTLTTSQNINSAAWPSRCPDSAGGSPDTDGHNIMIGVEVSTVMGAGTPTWTMGYTNSDGTSGRSIVTAAQATTMAVGSFIPIPLAAGDKGVRSIQTWQQSATMTSGAYHLVAYREIARLSIKTGNTGEAADALQLGFPRMYDDSVPFLLWLPSSTTAPTIQGQAIYSHG